MFRVGQKVVYVGPDGRDNPYDVIIPAPGGVYTIRAIRLMTRSLHNCEGTSILLDEIKNRNHAIGIEHGFNSIYFRPIVERKTDISIFQKMLTPQTVDGS